MKFISSLFFFLFITFVSVAEAHQGTSHVTYQQPDGGKFLNLHVIGDHLYSRTETADGYTVVYNPADKTYYYAALNADGSELIRSEVKAGEQAPGNLVKKLKITPESRKQKALARVDKQHQAERDAKWTKKQKATKEKRIKKLKEMRDRRLKKPEPEEDAKAKKTDDEKNVDGAQGGADTKTTPNSETTKLNAVELNNALADPEIKVGLTILVQFPDDPSTVDDDPVVFPATREKIERYCNEEGYTDDGNTGSVRDYFYDQSNGLLDYTMSVTQIITMPQPRDYYNYEDYPTNNTLRASGQSGRLLMADSAEVLKNENFDFSGLSFDSNGNVLSTNIFFAGGTSGVWPLGLWPHQWATAYSSRPEIIVNGEVRYLYLYQITNLFTNSATVGTFIHESGHLILDYPDLYDYGGESSGIGTHGIMASGNFGNGGKSPTPINLYFKDILGWAEVTDIEAFDYVEASLPTTGNIGYRITNPNDIDEFFIIENRGYANGAIGGDKWAEHSPDEGIMIWHVDDGVIGNNDEQMTQAQHYQVSLEQQDGLFELESGGSADAQDAYDINSANFNDNSSPNADWWSGASSGISINVESSPGVMMDVIFGLDVDLAVISPNGGEIFLEDQQVNIEWNGNATGNVKIDLLKSGLFIETLTANTSNDGSFLWGVTSDYEKADDYRIRVTIVNDGSIVDESDTDFGISTEQFVASGIFPSGWLQSAGSDAGWSVANDEASEGNYSLKSNAIIDDEVAQVEYQTTTEAGVITFDAKVSSEDGFDFLEFYIDGIAQDLDTASTDTGISGDSGWVSYSFPVTAGVHMLRWSYEKDFSVSSLDDEAWIDKVVIPELSLTGIDLWRANNFDEGAPGEMADLADPDGDGYSNLLEYAFGTDPNDPMSMSPLKIIRDGTNLSIIYNQNMIAADLVFEHQYRADLGLASWLLTSVTEEVMGTTGSIQTMKATMTVPESEKHHFMRLKVDLAE